MPAPFKWTSEQIQDMVASYEQGESVTSIATRYGTSQQVIGPVLKGHGVRLRSHNETMRRHTCNYTYFHRSCSLTICSPEMAADLAAHGLLPNKTFSTRA